MKDGFASAGATASAVRNGEVRAAEVASLCLERIHARDPAVRAFVEVDEEGMREQAAAVDAARDAGRALGPLAGVPIAIKDNYARRGHGATCGSNILEGFTSPYSATVVERLVEAGAVIVGRTNMDEFAMGSSTEHSRYGATHNPYDTTRSPGGSSGGSAAAVAARMVPLALGSDTGGSVRQPAALCGIAGLKPTYGRISRFGLVAFGSSLDCVAPLATNIEDLALVLGVLAGVDPRDSTSLDAPVPDYEQGHGDLQGLRIGVPEEYFADGLDPEIEQLTRAALDTLGGLGADLVPLSMPHTRYAIPTYYLVATAEASSNLARYDGVRYGRRAGGDGDLQEMYLATRSEGFGPEVQRRILLGCYCLRQGYVDEWYLKATKVRTLIRRDFDLALEKCDVIASPTSPIPAFALGEKIDDPLAMYLCDALTTPANLAGIPALSVPCGFTRGGLPAGLQLMGGALEESTLFRTAGAFERATGFAEPGPEL